MAEVLLARLGGERFRAFSAGSHPKSSPNELTLELLESLGYETKRLRSKSWDEFARPESPRLDFIFTVCASAAKESCPVWLGQPTSAHWGVEDPASFRGTPEETRELFHSVLDRLASKVRRLVELDLQGSKAKPGGLLESSMDRRILEARLAEIGRS